MPRHAARVEVGGTYYLRTWSSGSTAAHDAMSVLGCVVAARRHAEDATRQLYYFRTTHISEGGSDSAHDLVASCSSSTSNNSSSGGAAASSRRRVVSLSSALRGGASAGERSELTLHHHTLTSTQGYVYSYDGWYDADDLCSVDEHNKSSSSSSCSAATTAAAAALSRVTADTLPDDWLDAMERSSAVCELRYVCYTMRPWFHSPFDVLGYLALAERDCCYSVHVCHRCLCVFFSAAHLTTHLSGYCAQSRPPGVLLYHDRDTHRKLYYVDGAQHLHYARCLCLLGKCFIESKLLHNDVDLYEFFVVTTPRASLPYVPCAATDGRNDHDDDDDAEAATSSNSSSAAQAAFRRCAAAFDARAWCGDVVAGYFSRLKHHADHALSCIVTLPPFQRTHTATFMLDAAYYLTRERQRQCGCAAHCGRAGGAISRPFSPLGHALLLSYWRAALLRGAWRRALHERAHMHNNNDDVNANDDDDDDERTRVAHTYTLRSVDEVRTLMDAAVHRDDVVYLLTHDTLAYYSTTRPRTTASLHDNDNDNNNNGSMDTRKAGDATTANVSASSSSSVVVTLVMDATTSSTTRALLRRGDVPGRFHIKWVCKDATGAPLYTRALYHY